MLFVISGAGRGAGKTYLAHKLAKSPTYVYSIADTLRDDLLRMYPEYDWHNKKQSYKDTTLVRELSNKTIRDVLFEYGQETAKNNPTYWVKRLLDVMPLNDRYDTYVDDVRKVAELGAFRQHCECTHIHVENPNAVPEPAFDNDLLSVIADYRISWVRK